MVELREHQGRVLDQLKTGAILQGGVGSGKSITGLAYYYIYELGGTVNPLTKPICDTPLYIITTASKRDKLEWDEECLRFILSRKEKFSIGGIKVVIDSWNNIQNYVGVEGAFFIFDEQRLVGSGAWSKAFLKIAKKNKWIVLTATPGDTWIDYVPIFIANGFYKNRTEFIVKHVVYSRFSKYPKIDHYVDVPELIKHRDEIVIPMSYSHEIVIHDKVLKAPHDEKAMEIISKKRWNVFTDKPIKNAGELCYVQRQLVNSDPSRLELLLSVHKKHPKLIVFYNFNYELYLMRECLEKHNIRYAEWNGHKHEPVPLSDDWVYLVQYTAGAEGWNCITTNAMLFYSENYSYKVRVQAKGRIDRLTTPFDELFYFFVRSESVIDRSIGYALELKRNFNEREYEASFA
jgi:hypothetical protein